MSHFRIAAFSIAVCFLLFVGITSFFPNIYSSVVWSCIWALILVILLYAIYRTALWRNPPVFILHLAFMAIISGGFLTSVYSYRGTLHLNPSQPVDSFIDERGTLRQLPSEITLMTFDTEYYSGMNFPKDFKSKVAVTSGDTMYISMNHIGQLEGFRFYQTSFDDNNGSILTVSYDPYGMAVVYLGFFMFAVGGGWLLLRNIRFNFRAMLLFVFATCAGIGSEEISAVPAISKHTADSLSYRQVLCNGEVIPFNTIATRFTYKLTGKSNVGGLSPEQFVASLIKYREDWTKVPFIKVKNSALLHKLNIDGDYVAIDDLYNKEGTYLPGLIYKGGKGNLDEDIIKLDEKIALLIDLWKGDLFSPLPIDYPLLRSDVSVKTEVLYNRLNVTKIFFICSFLISFVLLLSLIFHKNINLRWAIWIMGGLAIVSFLCKIYISGRFPLSTTYEMMEFIAVCILLISGYISYRNFSSLLIGVVMICVSFMFLVAWLGLKDPIMTPVMPVLASPWLSIHVSLIMMSYAILGITLPISTTAIAIKRQRERLTDLSLKLLLPGTYILGLGVIVGAMWANVSWGRYWAWDPKETWALVTLLLYSLPLHRFFRLRSVPLIYNLYIIVIFGSIIMTYYGVNYLPSLHAYK